MKLVDYANSIDLICEICSSGSDTEITLLFFTAEIFGTTYKKVAWDVEVMRKAHEKFVPKDEALKLVSL